MAARLLWRYPGISRIDIANKLGVYRSTISNIINALVETGVVLESRKENCSSLGGRKPLQLELNPDFGCVAGIELQPSVYCRNYRFYRGCSRKQVGPLPEGSLTASGQDHGRPGGRYPFGGTRPLAVCMGLPGIIDACGARYPFDI